MNMSKYNYPHHKNSGHQLNINKINTEYEIIKVESLEIMDFS